MKYSQLQQTLLLQIWQSRNLPSEIDNLCMLNTRSLTYASAFVADGILAPANKLVVGSYIGFSLINEDKLKQICTASGLITDMGELTDTGTKLIRTPIPESLHTMFLNNRAKCH